MCPHPIGLNLTFQLFSGDHGNVTQCKKSEKSDHRFTRYRDFKIERSDWPSLEVNGPNLNFDKKYSAGSRDIVISKSSDLIGRAFLPPGRYPRGVHKNVLKNDSTRRYGSNEVSTLSIESFFCTINFFDIF
mgnify:CR=1 FL=1